MSRIHDALKKAEQERTDTALPEDALRKSAAGVVPASKPDLSLPVVTERAGMPAAAPPVFSDAAALRKLVLERSTKCSWNPDRRVMLLFDRRVPIIGLEEFRTLRSRLYLMREQEPLQTVLVTSPLPQEGKTFVAMNLAQVIVRQPERRALLIDSDLRFPRSHVSLGAPPTPGLSDYLRGEADEFSVIQRGPVDNLFFIPGGQTVPNPGELIANGRLSLLLHRLAPAFDWIILDSPPVIPVSDAKVVAPHCDGVLVVVEAAATPFDLAQKACQEFAGRRLLGVVLNRAEDGRAYSSYHYYQQGSGKVNNGKR